MKRIIKLLMLLLCIGCLTGCGGPKEVEINAYVDVTFEGYDTLGVIAEYKFDAKQLLKDYEKELENVSKKELERLLEAAIQFDKTTELTNGDKVTVEWDIDEDDLQEFEEEKGIKLVFADFTIIVENLEKLESFDPFEKISVQYEGYAPYARAYIEKALSSDDVGYRDFYYQLDKSDNLSNGDVVTVTVGCYEEDFSKFCIENYGKLPSTQTKEFTVSGCPEYVKDATLIPSEDMTKLGENIKDALEQKAAGWVFPESYCGMTYMGCVFAKAKTDSRYSTENTLYLVYKVDIDSIRDGVFSYYYYGKIDNLLFDENGVLTNDLEAVEVPKMSSGWFLSGTYFEHCDLYYEGYLTYEEFYAAQIQPLLEKYTVTDTVNKELITKQTHEPKDYSKITAEVKLGADCFTYKWYLGSYFVSGLTEKGYQELTKYSGSDYISLKLPAATEDGSVVEGMYSSKAEGGYSFSALAAANLPCVELVCPETYISFYGFCEDYKFEENYAFKLRNIVLNESLTEIASGAFRNCTGLEEIVIPAKIEKLPEQAFYGCSGLKKVVFPDALTTIEKEAFAYCSSLIIDSMNIGAMKIGANAFYGVTVNTVTIDGDDFTSDRYTSWGTLYASWNGATIKKLVITEDVTEIVDYAFEGAIGITEITIPASVAKIGARAFAGNAALTSVNLSEGLKTIGEEAFESSVALKKIEIPSTVVSIEKSAFANCPLLVIDSLEIGTLKIAGNAFKGVTLNTVTLTENSYTPDRYSSWGTVYTPWNGAIIKKLVVGEGITQLPDYAFEYAIGFTEVMIPASVTQIGTRAFAGNSDLKTVTLAEGLECIGEEAFDECAALKTINMPASLTEIKKSAFEGCTNLALESLEISKLTIEANAFYGATIKELTLSQDGYVSTRYSSWGTVYTPWNGATVKKITIKDGVTAIPDYAFEYCNGVTEVVIPDSVKNIGAGSFYQCSNLKTVTIPASVALIGVDAFTASSELTIYAPADTAAEIYARAAEIAFSTIN